MKKLLLVCLMLVVAGCNGEDHRKTDAEVAEDARLFVTGTNGYHGFQMEVRCVDGVQYYFMQQGYSAYFAPVVDRTTLQFKPCGIP